MEGRFATRRNRRLPSGRSALRSLLRNERGGAMIEIMMASLLVVMVATAVFKGIDGASATSSGSKSRATAAAIAESDQERLRGVPPAELQNVNETNDVFRNDVKFTVKSSVKWVADRTATPDCNTATSRAGYLRIRSEVTWPDMRGSRPVVQASLVAPPNGTVTTNLGAIGIRVLNEQNNGVPGVNVNVSGASLPAKQTDSNGCAYWDEVPQGNYSYTASKAGYVDVNGNPSVTRTIGAAGGQTRFDSLYLDAATSMNVQAVTRRYNGPEVKASGSSDDTMSFDVPLRVANGRMAGGVRVFPSSTAATRSAAGLYPMQYSAYLGPCSQSNNPVSLGAGWSNFNPPFATPTKVWLPSINVQGSLNGSTTAVAGFTVFVKLVPLNGETCNIPRYERQLNSAGRFDRPEFPPGRYVVCAEVNQSGWWHAKETVDNVSQGGVAVTLNESKAETGRCPT